MTTIKDDNVRTVCIIPRYFLLHFYTNLSIYQYNMDWHIGKAQSIRL